MTAIKGFFKEYRWLSNFHLVPILYEGILYPSSEHAYQAAKTFAIDIRKEIAALSSPAKARKKGQEIRARPDWNSVKILVMTAVLRIKFNNPELKEMLLATGDTYLEETNWWKDTFWGVYDGIGENNLGKVLMKIREEIKS